MFLGIQAASLLTKTNKNQTNKKRAKKKNKTQRISQN